MATHTIKGNVSNGATVQLFSKEGDINQTQICDASGNYTFTVADVRTYFLVATPSDATKTCRFKHTVFVNGSGGRRELPSGFSKFTEQYSCHWRVLRRQNVYTREECT